MKPTTDQPYEFVKPIREGMVAYATFVRRADGSAGSYSNLPYVMSAPDDPSMHAKIVATIAEGRPKAWKSLWNELMRDGFVELSKAKAKGMVPPDWQRPFLVRGVE